MTYVRMVARLSGSDYRGILEFVHAAGEVEGPDPFPEHVLARLRELVPCDTVSSGDFDRDFDREGHVWRTGVRATRGTRGPRLSPPSARRMPGSPTSIHIGRGAPRQGARCAGLTCFHGASAMPSTCTGRFVARSTASTSSSSGSRHRTG